MGRPVDWGIRTEHDAAAACYGPGDLFPNGSIVPGGSRRCQGSPDQEDIQRVDGRANGKKQWGGASIGGWLTVKEGLLVFWECGPPELSAS